MKSLGTFVFGLIVGAGILGVGVYSAAPGMMIKEVQIAYSIEGAVDRIRESVEALNREQQTAWVIPDAKPLHKAIKKHGGEDVLPVVLVNLCEPTHASNILLVDDARMVSVMMPCTIAVYEKSDGNTYVSYMNAGLLGRMFGGVVARVMGDVDGQQGDILAALVN